MWNKLAHLVKPRSNEAAGDRTNDERQERPVTPDVSNSSAAMNGSVMSRVYEQHPNLSMFHSSSAVHLAPTSPPVSPSKGSKRSMFKRSLKAKLTSTPAAQAKSAADGDLLSPGSSVWTSPSPVKLIPKKLRASLQIDTFTAQTTNIAAAAGTAPLPVQPHTPTFGDQHGDDPLNTTTDIQPPGTGSIRSILRDRNTPGTGQSVRFFSRDAYRVITPNVSEGEINQDAIPGVDQEAFLEKLWNLSPDNSASSPAENANKYHSPSAIQSDNVVDMFSPPRQASSGTSRKPLPFQPRHPPRTHNTSNASHSSHSGSGSSTTSPSNSQSLSSLLIPPPPADMCNLFDVSQERELAEIPVSEEGSLRVDAVEEVEKRNPSQEMSSVSDISMKTIGRNSESTAFPSLTPTPYRDQSAAQPRSITSPEGTVFRSATDTVRANGRTPFRSFPGAANDRTAMTIFFTPDASHANINNKTVYFTPESGPLSPPNASANNKFVLPSGQMVPPAYAVGHSQGDLVSFLRGQLELQQQLAAQFEIDLSARDEVVSLLSTQLKEAEMGAEKYKKEVERRQGAMRILQRKVGELEKICRGLEEEVERSREESFERSIMDEASEGALVVLQGSIGQLKGELEKAKEGETKLREERDALKSEVERLVEEQGAQDEVEKELRCDVENATATIQTLEEKLSAVESEDQEKVAKLEADVIEMEHIIEQTVQERDAKLDELEQERRYASENVARLEDLLRVRDTENAEAQSRIIKREQVAEQLRAEMHKIKREHDRFADEQGRTLDETRQKEERSRRQMEDMVKQKAEDEVAIGSMKERLGILADETERLRRQVHDLQQESADKDIELLQFTKTRAQDKEDKDGLNIALDSKQQELELLKRALGVKGTGGLTPAPNRVGLPDLASRRQSAAFATPSAPRPKSSSTVSISKATPGAETPNRTRLGGSLHSNGASNSVAPSSAAKPARLGSMGPPPSRRSSVSVTPLSASTSGLSRSTSSRPRSALPLSAHRRSSSVMSIASTIPSGDEEKENAAPAKATSRTSRMAA